MGFSLVWGVMLLLLFGAIISSFLILVGGWCWCGRLCGIRCEVII